MPGWTSFAANNCIHYILSLPYWCILLFVFNYICILRKRVKWTVYSLTIQKGLSSSPARNTSSPLFWICRVRGWAEPFGTNHGGWLMSRQWTECWQLVLLTGHQICADSAHKPLPNTDGDPEFCSHGSPLFSLLSLSASFF